jgi:outer membrane lipoprotein-sorting protein
LKKKFNFILLIVLFFSFFSNYSEANFQEKFIDKYKTINTLSFDFTQKIGEKIEFGNCYIKYPLHMKCEYSNKKKSIIANGKKFVIIKKRYKKIYYYPLKKTPLFYLLEKKNILSLVKNYEPTKIESNMVEYELFLLVSRSLLYSKYFFFRANKIMVFFLMDNNKFFYISFLLLQIFCHLQLYFSFY